MKLIHLLLFIILFSSCKNYSFETEYSEYSKRVFRNNYNLDESFEDLGNFEYGIVSLKNIIRDKEIKYTIEQTETYYTEAFAEYKRPFVFYTNKVFFENIKPYSKIITNKKIIKKSIGPGESKKIGMKYKLEINSGLYENHNPLGDRNDPRYSSYNYIDNSNSHEKAYKITEDKPTKKLYKKVGVKKYTYKVVGWIEK